MSLDEKQHVAKVYTQACTAAYKEPGYSKKLSKSLKGVK
jgi:hypothetical protein